MKGGVRPLEDVIQQSRDLRGPATLRCVDVSHVTLRKSLTALVDEGVLRSAHGRGAASRVDQAVHRDSRNEGGRRREGKGLPPIGKRLVGPDKRHVCQVAPRSATFARYRDYVHGDLVPAFGRLRLAELRARHAADAGRTGVRPGSHQCPPGRRGFVQRAEPGRAHPSDRGQPGPVRGGGAAALIGTGMRRGEVLGLHWPEVHLAGRTLLVCWSLAAVDNNRLFLGHPKTRTGRNW